MSLWISITADDLNDYIVAEQMTALREAALALNQGDPFDSVAPNVIAKVRQFIASNPANEVDFATATIPPELKQDVCYLIIGPMLSRLNFKLSAFQTSQIEAANDTLKLIADKKLVVSKPGNPVAPDVQSPTGMQLVTSTRRKAKRDQLSGL